jgi:hypothetical protein
LIAILTLVPLSEDHPGNFFINKSDIVFDDANSGSRSFSLRTSKWFCTGRICTLNGTRELGGENPEGDS